MTHFFIFLKLVPTYHTKIQFPAIYDKKSKKWTDMWTKKFVKLIGIQKEIENNQN